MLGCSLLAIAASAAAPAWADCTPDPPVAGGTTVCTGLDANGLVVPVNATVRVEPGAQVLSGANAAIYSSSYYVSLLINGNVAGGTKPGVLLGGGNLNVGTTGDVSGATGVQLVSGFIDVANSGQIRGASGAGLNAGAGAAFNIVDNSAGATIAGIAGSIHYLRNYGTIDGGTASAIDAPVGTFSDGTLYSGGVIRTNSSAATLNLAARSVINEGTIENAGSGPAIYASGNLSIENRLAGARIASAGDTAIRTAGALTLKNLGTIQGSVVSTAAAGAASTVDTTLGAINGDLLLGSGNDTLLGNLDLTTGQVAGISGRVDGGAGIDTVITNISSDMTINAIVLPTNFERLGVNLVNSATVQLGGSVSSPFGIALAGVGKFSLLGDLVTSGPAFTAGPVNYPAALLFDNQGSITANLTGSAQRAIDLDALRLTNEGTITGNGGDGVRLTNSFGQTALVNDGSIAATGTAVTINRGDLTNSGTIRSTGGTALKLTGISSYDPSANSGTIDGATIGAAIDTAQLSNSGTIRGGTVGVTLGYSTTLDNLAGGTISGGSAAVTRGDGFSLSATVRNAGTINGDVDLRNATPNDSSGDVFVNNGGTVNGNVRLGGGNDVFVTDLGGSTGVTGSIDAGAGFDVVRYRVRTDASTIAAAPATFEGVDYELIGGAALAISAAATPAPTISISGVGKADLTVDIVGTDRTVLDLTGGALSALLPPTVNTPTSLDVISRGALSLTTTAASMSTYPPVAAVNAGMARFENAGTISVSSVAGSYYPAIAVFNGSEVVNSGLITLDNAVGIQNATHVVNSGSILQAAGGGSSQGVVAVQTLDNQGTISVDGAAVTPGNAYNSTVTNSGLIESRNAAAIQFGSGIRINNLAGGVIRGKNTAISSDRATIVNDGTITGDVVLGASGFSGSSVFVSNGTLTGNLVFGSSGSLFLQRGASTGVSGTITAAFGINTYGRSFGNSATTITGDALPTGFSRELVEARGSDTIVTLTSANTSPRDLYLVGDGGFVNRSNIDGIVYLTTLANLGANLDSGIIGSFTNAANISSVQGLVHTFANQGTIGSTTSPNPVAVNLQAYSSLAFSNDGAILNAVSIGGSGATGLSVANAGTIAGGVNAELSFAAGANPTVTLANSGAISGGVSAYLSLANDAAAGVAVANSGDITSDQENIAALQITQILTGAGSATMTLDNKGTIRATGAGSTGVALNDSQYETPTQIAATSIVNTGLIETTGAGEMGDITFYPGYTYHYFQPAIALSASGGANTSIVNGAGGTIAAGAEYSTAISVANTALKLDNAGKIIGNAGRQIAATATSSAFYLAGAVQSGDADDSIVNNGTIIGSIDVGGGNDRIENKGKIQGDVFLRDGDDTFIQHASAQLIGTVDGGAGTDALIVDATGGGSVNGDQFVNFENFAQTGTGNVVYSGHFNYAALSLSSGTASFAGDVRLNRIDMTGGRLIGLAGSTITAPQITIGAGATFGSAGTVVGDIAVAGTLSPGASPGTMTVTGNVSLAGSSLSLFELTPTVSDKLLVSGKLGIASGATLTLTADRPLTPGTKLDLIVANGGIIGSFATINKSPTVAGVLTQSADRIQLLATFLNGGFNPQVTAAVDYTNALLVAGQASAPLIAAMPKLLNSDGTTSGAAFAQVTPEAYASATQIGVENGLILAQASRNAAPTAGRDAGLFSFGQALGNWRKLDGRAAQGVSRANINSRGVMGGAGYGSSSASIGVFVGYLDSKQRIDPISARTDADGVIAGITGHYAAGAFDLSGVIAYDGANADTSRTLPGSSKVSGHYRLHSWIGDLAAEYRIPLGLNWGAKPSAGLTYVSVRRGRADEGAVNPLALKVLGHQSDATFIDGELALEGGLAPGASFHPWLSAGIRYQVNGRTSAATAGFAGTSLGFTAEGVVRQRSLPTSGAGFTLDAGPRLALYGAYRHDFGREGGGDSLNGGVRFRF